VPNPLFSFQRHSHSMLRKAAIFLLPSFAENCQKSLKKVIITLTPRLTIPHCLHTALPFYL
jgi:hypothetical protein